MSFLLNSFKLEKNQKLSYPELLSIKNRDYKVVVNEFNKRNSSVIVKSQTIEVRLSSKLSFKQKQRHIDELLVSISKKLQQVTIKKEVSFEDILKQGYFYCGDKKFYLDKFQGRGIKRKGDVLYLGVGSSNDALEKKLKLLLIDEFKDFIINRVEYINSISFRYSYGAVVVKLVSSKWGHCTTRNDLLFNIKLINAPLEVLDYVIYHELAHIKVKNHSSLFWGEVARFCPEFKELRKTLKINSPGLYRLS